MMLRIPKSLAPATVLVAAFLLGIIPADANPGVAPVQTARQTTVSGRTGDVYLLRGLMNVWSHGMDTLADELRRKGFQAQVVNHSSWGTVATAIAERYKATKHPEPVFLVGHSLGADAVILVAERLEQNGVPVALAVTFDPVHPRPVPRNVKRFVNFYQSTNGFGMPVKPGVGFRAQLVNTDLKDRGDLGHASIDKDGTLHKKVVDEMMRLSRPVRRQIAG